MAIILNGDTGISSIGALSGVTSLSGTNATLTGVTSVASNSADTPIILQDSSSNSNTCRAWVNFNGTGTVAIRADFNVSSITDDGTGGYTVNFTNAMPDANYSAVSTLGQSGGLVFARVTSPSTTQLSILSNATSTGTATDATYVNVSVFR